MNTGQESGLHYFEARYLSGARARLLSVDPKYVTSDSLSPAALRAFLSRPHELNLYAYTVNNPLEYIDPSGKTKAPGISSRKLP